MTVPPVVVWFRRDLRTRDHQALHAAQAAAGNGRVVPLFVLDPVLWKPAPPARQAWLSASVQALREATNGALVTRRGNPVEVLPKICEELGASEVHCTGDAAPFGRRRDAAVEKALGSIPLVATDTPYVVPPGTLTTGSGGPYQVFTPFYRAWSAHLGVPPGVKPTRVHWQTGLDSDALPRLQTVDSRVAVEAGEEMALARWQRFVGQHLCDYDEQRDRPDLDGTSKMSVHLKFGEIHPRTMLRTLSAHTCEGAAEYRRQLAWRDFFADVLWHRPETVTQYLRPQYAVMEFDPPDVAFAAWTEGRTGYPFVDAGMRQLAATGWMHNRVRMVTASFLVKDLHVEWTHGARYFMNMLLDADVASNQHNWQWVAGSGADAAPFFRIFNPVLQGQRFDPSGDYIRRWVPELRDVSGTAIHQPWRLGSAAPSDYPAPMIDHAEERIEALRRFAEIRDR